MEKQHPINEMMSTTMEKIRSMMDANTIIGDPIQTGEVTLIPVSRLSFGFASGGSDFVTKNQKPGEHLWRGQRRQREDGAGGLPHHQGGQRQAAPGRSTSRHHGGPGHRGGA